MSSIEKNGNVNATFVESMSGSIFNGTKYTRDNPCVLTGTSTDIIATTNNYTQVIPKKTYYLLCSCDSGWSPSHGYSEASAGKATIWLYMSKTFNANSMGYDSPVLFTSASMIADGVWKYTVPDGYNMARARLNTYSDGTNSVSVKFWDIALIPEENYVGQGGSAMKIYNNKIVTNEIIEI